MALLVGAVAACGETILPGEEVEFTLRVGESARLADHDVSVRFVGVPQDSRCPENAICTWEGDGAIALRLDHGQRQVDTTLHTSLSPRSVTADGLSLEVIGLAPAPRAGEPIEPGAYRVRLRARGG